MAPDFEIELRAGAGRRNNPPVIAGVDEVGRGAWAGPVYAAAVILAPGEIPPGINDSKKLSPRKRENVAMALRDCATYGIGRASAQEVDQLGINPANDLAIARALLSLRQDADLILIDGSRRPALPRRLAKSDVQMITRGDAISLSVAAASILAKTARDRELRAIHEIFPAYALASNKGYGVAAHRNALKKFGPTPIHRISFAPIRQMLWP